MTAEEAKSKAFAEWCIMSHARPALVEVLRAWGLPGAAAEIEQAASLSAVRLLASDVITLVRKAIVFVPLRRDLSHAATTLQVAATFAARSDAENTAAVVVGVFTHVESALLWKRPWSRLTWRKQRAEIIRRVRREQNEYLASLRSEPAAHRAPQDGA
jgi:hypothetical protein